MIYTTYFDKLKSLPENIIPISICGKAPDWYKGLQYKKLAPKYYFFMKWKETQDNNYYIEHYQSLAVLGKGYNVSLGGKGYCTTDQTLVNKLWYEGKSINEITTETGSNRCSIRHALVSNPTYSTEEARKRGNT